MKYIKEDLDYIFIRVKDSKGKWGNLSLAKVSDKQFVEWATKRFDIEIRDDSDVVGKSWTPKQKVDFLNDMSKRIDGKDCVTMIRRDVRDEWGKNETKN